MDPAKINSLFRFFFFSFVFFHPKNERMNKLSHYIQPSESVKLSTDQTTKRFLMNTMVWWTETVEKTFTIFRSLSQLGQKKVRSDLRVVPEESLCCYFNRGFSNFTVGLSFGPVHKIQFFPRPKPDMKFRYGTELTSNGRINKVACWSNCCWFEIFRRLKNKGKNWSWLE